MTTPTVGSILQSFFMDKLSVQKGLSKTSISSYRDTLRLFLQYTSKVVGKPITKLSLNDLSCDRVLGFLKFIEDTRNNCVRTRNQRLAAIHTFYKHLAACAPEMLSEAERGAGIPVKRTPPPETIFLERDEVNSLFANLPSKGTYAFRDRTLLLFLYNTGARAQEVADLQVKNLQLDEPLRVHLHGKGDKWRTCPLWQSTANQLKQLIAKRNSESPVFVSRSGRTLTRFGIYRIVRKLTMNLSPKKLPNKKRISPHSFRHTSACHLLESGVDVNVIRAWLGHVSLETTNRYAEINIRMKSEALQICEPPTGAKVHARIKWRDDETLLKWLESL
jgi:site-specific recombinase XerD